VVVALCAVRNYSGDHPLRARSEIIAANSSDHPLRGLAVAATLCSVLHARSGVIAAIALHVRGLESRTIPPHRRRHGQAVPIARPLAPHRRPPALSCWWCLSPPPPPFSLSVLSVLLSAICSALCARDALAALLPLAALLAALAALMPSKPHTRRCLGVCDIELNC
jgi:hypothetical protein